MFQVSPSKYLSLPWPVLGLLLAGACGTLVGNPSTQKPADTNPPKNVPGKDPTPTGPDVGRNGTDLQVCEYVEKVTATTTKGKGTVTIKFDPLPSPLPDVTILLPSQEVTNVLPLTINAIGKYEFTVSNDGYEACKISKSFAAEADLQYEFVWTVNLKKVALKLK